jgi:hypothetical protein
VLKTVQKFGSKKQGSLNIPERRNTMPDVNKGGTWVAIIGCVFATMQAACSSD